MAPDTSSPSNFVHWVRTRRRDWTLLRGCIAKLEGDGNLNADAVRALTCVEELCHRLEKDELDRAIKVQEEIVADLQSQVDASVETDEA